MLPKNTTHFLLAGLLVLTGACAIASDSEQTPFKTAEQQKHALSLLGGIALAKAKSDAEEAPHFEGLLKPCITYVANEREIKKEREKCEIAATQAFADCTMMLQAGLLFPSADRAENEELCFKYRLLRDTGRLLLPNRIYDEDGLNFVMEEQQ